MRIAVIGSRTIESIDFNAVGAVDGDTIVTGGARGVDTIAETEARARGLDVVVLRPDYARYGRGATHVRNRAIVDACDRLVSFWDGKSRGTAGTMAYARKQGKTVDVHGG